ncbi:MAG TPA: radical SAM protein [bacterium]|nr:radical SAM protein [bacterium]
MFRYIYGPVGSWRLGSSLGIDLLSMKQKICSFDCIYCQIGNTEIFSCERKIFVSEKDVIAELEQLPDVQIDYYTFSGRGEPTLAKNIKEIAEWIKNKQHGRCALLTNSSTITDTSLWNDLLPMDLISFKIDAATQETFERVNKPCCNIKIKDIIEGVSEFTKMYKGLFTIQIMMVEENLSEADKIACICKELKPDLVYLNTPLRDSSVRPLTRKEFSAIAGFFNQIPHLSVFEAKKNPVKPISYDDTIKRRGKKI